MTILAFGEVLIDGLPSGDVPGGAPMNVAVHAARLGSRSALISSVGDDPDGQHLRSFLTSHGVAPDYLALSAVPTGRVRVDLNAAGSPAYTILAPAAWDHIPATGPSLTAAATARYFVYGTLAARHPDSRASLLAHLERAAFPVLDLNLRPPFDDLVALDPLLRAARGLKVNDEELARLGGTPATTLTRWHLDWLCVTHGSDGASFHTPTGSWHVPAVPVQVVDTVGAGDAFLAGLLVALGNGLPPAEALTAGAREGARVAGQRGSV